MIFRLQILILTFCISSCLSPHGYPSRSVLSKTQLIKWYSDNLQKYPTIDKFGYAGSEDDFHYFIVRPVDDFVIHEVPRSDLKIPDVRLRSELGRSLYFYLVDPSNNFKKVPEP